MKCPKCETTSLEAREFKGIEVDCCPQCRGIWFDQDELPHFLGLTRSELRSLQSGKLDEQLNRKQGRCPRDESQLLRVYSPRNTDVVIDSCVTCNGIWLDDGELKKLNE